MSGQAMSKISAIRCRPFPHRRLPQLLVEVETDGGHRGLGEAWWGIPSPDPAVAENAGFAPIQAAIEHLLAPRSIGKSADDIEGLWFSLSDWAARYGDGGIITMALAGIDLALWDLQGKRLGVPVVQLLGGKAHERVPAYASLPPLRTTDSVIHECRRAIAAGFRAVKLHEVEVDLVARSREAVGRDIKLMVDVNGHFDLNEAIAFGRAIAPFDILWYEEPVRPMRNHHAIASVAKAQPIDLAAGENEYSLDDFSRLLQRDALSFLQPEITKIGGLTPARKIAALAELHNVALAPHNFRIGPSLYSSIHWGFSSPATRWFELPWLPEGVNATCGAVLPKVVDGCVTLPEGPGFGLTL
jgi:L-alanine-DL-glutamate epimerase-like enolase superfamily enzyme